MSIVVGFMGTLNGVLDKARETMVEASEAISGASAWAITGAIAWVEALALRVAHEFVVQFWYLLKPQVRMPLLFISVSLFYACLVNFTHIVIVRLQESGFRDCGKTSVSAMPVKGKTGETLPCHSRALRPEKTIFIDGSLTPSPAEIDKRYTFESLTSTDVEETVMNGKENQECSSQEEDLAKLLTSNNHLSDTPEPQPKRIEPRKSKTKVKPYGEEEVSLKQLKTPQTIRDRRRLIATTNDNAATTLGSTVTPAGVRQSARIRASRQVA